MHYTRVTAPGRTAAPESRMDGSMAVGASAQPKRSTPVHQTSAGAALPYAAVRT